MFGSVCIIGIWCCCNRIGLVMFDICRMCGELMVLVQRMVFFVLVNQVLFLLVNLMLVYIGFCLFCFMCRWFMWELVMMVRLLFFMVGCRKVLEVFQCMLCFWLMLKQLEFLLLLQLKFLILGMLFLVVVLWKVLRIFQCKCCFFMCYLLLILWNWLVLR